MTVTSDDFIELYRNDFGSFVRFAFDLIYGGVRFEPNWHIDVMADYLERCERGEVTRLIINVPPRSLKSFCASVALPAWALARVPTRKVLSIGGNRGLREDLATNVSLLMNADRYRSVFPHVQPSAKNNGLALPHGGSWKSQALSTPLTGQGADIVIIDDPLSPQEAKKTSTRQRVNEWFDENIEQRLNNKSKGIIIVVMQRLHHNDLTGHLLAKGADWTLVNIPAVAETDENWPLSNGGVHARNTGDLLFPQRDSRETLCDTLIKIGASKFAAQYQQKPFLPADSNEEIRGNFFVYDENGNEKQVLGRVSKVAIMLHELFGIGKHPIPPELNCPEADKRRKKEWLERVENEADKPRPNHIDEVDKSAGT